MIQELEYRTFDQLLDSVKLDFEMFDIENMISNQTLIKVAQRINSEIGLKIHPSKGKVLELHNGKAKLPSDLKVLNFALLCSGETTCDIISYPYSYGTFDQGVIEGRLQTEADLAGRMVKQYTEIITVEEGVNRIDHNLGTTNVVIQAFGPNGNLLSFDISIVNSNAINIISESTETLTNIKVVILGSNSSYGVYCPATPTSVCDVDPDIMTVEPAPTCATLNCQSGGCNTVAYTDKNKVKTYSELILLNIKSSKSTTFDEVNVDNEHYNTIVVKNGYILSPFDDAVIFINYEGQMEDDDGNLLVLDHPTVNEYYEYALKTRICENLIAAKHQVQNLFSLMNQQLRKAKQDALSYIRTPDFKELHRVWKMNRKIMNHKYLDMFKN